MEPVTPPPPVVGAAAVPRQRGPFNELTGRSRDSPDGPSTLPPGPADGPSTPPPGSAQPPPPALPSGGTRVPAAATSTVRSALARIDPPDDEPVAVVLAGGGTEARAAVLTALLGGTAVGVVRPAESYLVVGYGTAARIAVRVPGWSHRRPGLDRPSIIGDESAPPRPPRRVEVTRTDSVLRHLRFVDTPDTDPKTPAGVAVLVDAVRRAGALLFVIGAGPPPHQADYDLLRRALAVGAEIFCVVTLGGAQSEGDAPYRAAVVAEVPGLADAPWFVVDADAAGVVHLRRALIDWADREALHRTGAGLAELDMSAALTAAGRPELAAGGGPAPGLADGSDSGPQSAGGGDSGPGESGPGRPGWERRLDRVVHRAGRRVRWDLAIALAGVHVTVVPELMYGGGPASGAGFLDRELLALSLRAAVADAEAIDWIIDEMVLAVFGADRPQTLRFLLREQLRRRIGTDPGSGSVPIALLVGPAAEVDVVAGPEASSAGPVDVYFAYPSPPSRYPVAPIGIALTADCWHPVGGLAGMAPHQAHSWVQRAVRGLELSLEEAIESRFTLIRRHLADLLADLLAEAIDGGAPRR